jgi:hypothetical protein
MKNIGLVGVAVVSFLGVVGCGSSTDDGDGTRGVSEKTNAAKARFTAGPTAVLTKSNGALALSETKRQESSGAGALKGNPLGGGSDGSSTKSLAIRSLRILGDEPPVTETGPSDPAASCPDIVADKDKGTCACPGGGKLTYDVPNLKALKAKGDSLPEEIDLALSYQACVMENTKYDGSMGILMSKKSVVKVGSKTATAAPAAGGMNMLIVADELTIGGEKLDFAFAMDGGQFYYAPSVDEKGGYVLSELSATGETKVHAKNGTFDCKVESDGEGECKNEESGETLPVKEDSR